MRITHTTIQGEPYTLTWLNDTAAGPGWKVTATTSPTDNFHRSYFVRTMPDGEPLRCTCADCHYRGNWCKHCKAVETIHRLDHPQAVVDLMHAARAHGIGDEPGAPPTAEWERLVAEYEAGNI